MTTGKRAEKTKRDFWCPIFRSAIGQATCLICARRRQLTHSFSVAKSALYIENKFSKSVVVFLLPMLSTCQATVNFFVGDKGVERDNWRLTPNVSN